MINHFTRFVATIRFKRLYTCMTCGAQEEGETERIQIDQHHTDAAYIGDKLSAMPLKGTGMPVHWASYLEGMRCPNCNI